MIRPVDVLCAVIAVALGVAGSWYFSNNPISLMPEPEPAQIEIPAHQK